MSIDLSFSKKFNDFGFAAAILGVIFLMLIPLPPFLLDLLLTISLLLSVMTLLLTLYVRETLDFSTFPTLLLFLSCFRLGLNFASTRMILSTQETGKIIQTFGEFVCSGSHLIGLLLFTLLTIVNFMVITKGTGRIAEVAARFTLEALPGKQLAIENEMQGQLISKEEARIAYDKVNREADFFGSMDGAAKFLRGEAIATLLITAVNILGGLVVGLCYCGYSLVESFQLFTLLTIGDGLVTQLPALLVSLGAGILVTRSSSTSLSQTLPEQLFSNPKVLNIGAFLLILLAFIPGMPKGILFLSGGALFVFSAAQKKQQGKKRPLFTPPLELILGSSSQKKQLEKALPQAQTQWEERLGIQLPSIYLAVDKTLPENSYVFKIKGIVSYQGGVGILEAFLDKLRSQTYMHAHELISRQQVAHLLEKARLMDKAVVEELQGRKFHLSDLFKLIQNLLKEQVPVRDFISLLEIVADHLAKGSFDIELMTEHVRIRFAPTILEHFFGSQPNLHVITLDSEVEEIISSAFQKGGHEGRPEVRPGSRFLLPPKIVENIEHTLEIFLKKAEEQKISPLLLTSTKNRISISKLFDKQRGRLPVFSYAEMGSRKVRSLGQITSETLAMDLVSIQHPSSS